MEPSDTCGMLNGRRNFPNQKNGRCISQLSAQIYSITVRKVLVCNVWKGVRIGCNVLVWNVWKGLDWLYMITVCSCLLRVCEIIIHFGIMAEWVQCTLLLNERMTWKDTWHGSIRGWMDGSMNAWMHTWVDWRTNDWMDGRMNGWTTGM